MENFSNKIDGVILSPQKIINTVGGNVLHVIKNQDKTFSGFGEDLVILAWFSDSPCFSASAAFLT